MSVFKRFLPKGLFARTLLIIVLPVGLMQDLGWRADAASPLIGWAVSA